LSRMVAKGWRRPPPSRCEGGALLHHPPQVRRRAGDVHGGAVRYGHTAVALRRPPDADASQRRGCGPQRHPRRWGFSDGSDRRRHGCEPKPCPSRPLRRPTARSKGLASAAAVSLRSCIYIIGGARNCGEQSEEVVNSCYRCGPAGGGDASTHSPTHAPIGGCQRGTRSPSHRFRCPLVWIPPRFRHLLTVGTLAAPHSGTSKPAFPIVVTPPQGQPPSPVRVPRPRPSRRFRPRDGEWRLMAPMRTGRMFPAAAALGRSIYVTAGVTPSSEGWKQVPTPRPPEVRKEDGGLTAGWFASSASVGCATVRTASFFETSGSWRLGWLGDQGAQADHGSVFLSPSADSVCVGITPLSWSTSFK